MLKAVENDVNSSADNALDKEVDSALADSEQSINASLESADDVNNVAVDALEGGSSSGEDTSDDLIASDDSSELRDAGLSFVQVASAAQADAHTSEPAPRESTHGARIKGVADERTCALSPRLAHESHVRRASTAAASGRTPPSGRRLCWSAPRVACERARARSGAGSAWWPAAAAAWRVAGGRTPHGKSALTRALPPRACRGE